jgi:hypothetical protein
MSETAQDGKGRSESTDIVEECGWANERASTMSFALILLHYITMKLILISTLAAIALTFCGHVGAQEKSAGAVDKPKDAPVSRSTEKPKAAPEGLEAKFKSTLTKATLTGRWCAIQGGTLGPEKEDKYTIISVTKLVGDAWLINTRIQYNQKDIVAPIPVQVKWAGDTPVIIVDKIAVPGGGTYPARVLIYEHTYAGTWSGGDHGGLLNGVITNEKD